MKIAFSQRTWQWNMFIHGAYGCGVETDSGQSWGGLGGAEEVARTYPLVN